MINHIGHTCFALFSSHIIFRVTLSSDIKMGHGIPNYRSGSKKELFKCAACQKEPLMKWILREKRPLILFINDFEALLANG